jgi:hypothetical protein
MCEAHVNDVIRKNFDVKKIKSSHKKNLTSFLSEALIDEAKLKSIIGETGYKLEKIKYEEK